VDPFESVSFVHLSLQKERSPIKKHQQVGRISGVQLSKLSFLAALFTRSPLRKSLRFISK
jgi:hypothetical protein